MEYWEINNSSEALLDVIGNNMDIIMPAIYPVQATTTLNNITYHIDVIKHLENRINNIDDLRPNNLDLHEQVESLLFQTQRFIAPNPAELLQITANSINLIQQRFGDIVARDNYILSVARDITEDWRNMITAHHQGSLNENNNQLYNLDIERISRVLPDFQHNTGAELLRVLTNAIPPNTFNAEIVEAPFIGRIDQLPAIEEVEEPEEEIEEEIVEVVLPAPQAGRQLMLVNASNDLLIAVMNNMDLLMPAIYPVQLITRPGGEKIYIIDAAKHLENRLNNIDDLHPNNLDLREQVESLLYQIQGNRGFNANEVNQVIENSLDLLRGRFEDIIQNREQQIYYIDQIAEQFSYMIRSYERGMFNENTPAFFNVLVEDASRYLGFYEHAGAELLQVLRNALPNNSIDPNIIEAPFIGRINQLPVRPLAYEVIRDAIIEPAVLEQVIVPVIDVIDEPAAIEEENPGIVANNPIEAIANHLLAQPEIVPIVQEAEEVIEEEIVEVVLPAPQAGRQLMLVNASNDLLIAVMNNMDLLMPAIYPVQLITRAGGEEIYIIDAAKHLENRLNNIDDLHPNNLDLREQVEYLLYQIQGNRGFNANEVNQVIENSLDLLRQRFEDIIQNREQQIYCIDQIAEQFNYMVRSYQNGIFNENTPAFFNLLVEDASRYLGFYEHAGAELLQVLRNALPNNSIDPNIIEAPFIGRINQLPARPLAYEVIRDAIIEPIVLEQVIVPVIDVIDEPAAIEEENPGIVANNPIEAIANPLGQPQMVIEEAVLEPIGEDAEPEEEIIEELEEIDDLEMLNPLRSQAEYTRDMTIRKTGNMPGYFAYETNNPANRVLIKQIYKEHQPHDVNANIDRGSFVNEIMAANLFLQLLGNRAPNIELLRADERHQDYMYLSSAFIPNTETLMNFIGRNPNMNNINGFERNVAASQIIGDKDYHPLNLLRGGANLYKIDHGEAFKEDIQGSRDFIRNLYNNFITYGYIDNGQNTINFNIHRYANHLLDMLAYVNVQEIHENIDENIRLLQNATFDPVGLTLNNHDNTVRHEIYTFDELADHYKNFIARHIDRIEDIALDIYVISRFSNVTQQFQQGGWIQELSQRFNDANSDIIGWAARNGMLIEGRNPIAWARDNNFKNYARR